MKKLLARVILTVFGIGLVAGVATALPLFTKPADPNSSTPAIVQAFQPQKAAADCGFPYWCRARFRSVDHEYILMCHNWGSCAPGSVIKYHQTTRWTFGWVDTDGFYVPSGANIAIKRADTPPPGTTFSWHHYRPTGWTKKHGCFACTFNIKRYPQLINMRALVPVRLT